MKEILSKSIFLLTSLVIIICGIYPMLLWLVGQTLFSFQANGSIVISADKKPIGSLLIAQPFTKKEYFRPRPSAAAYDASASASSSLAASNYALRGRVAQSLAAIAKHSESGENLGSDIEKWFQMNNFQSKGNIIEQWVLIYPSQPQAWVNADPLHATYVKEWSRSHPEIVSQFIKDHPQISSPTPGDLAVVFFQNLSQEFPGKFPIQASRLGSNGKMESSITLSNAGAEIQSLFFDMWRKDHPDISLQAVPGDLVTTSASGLDPHITLQNAKFQLEEVATTWGARLKRDENIVKAEIMEILQQNAMSPLGGLAGEPFVNVLQINLELNKRYGAI